jgi:cytochrome c peroxidase
VRGDQKALSPAAVRGFAVFNGKGQCASCHGGWNFSDEKFHDIGLNTTDEGRAAVTKKPEDKFGFRTPGLREIAARAPYMHNGSLPTLQVVVAHYMTGGVDRPSRSKLMTPLSLTPQDMTDLVEFMNALSSPGVTVALPNLPAR